MSDWRENETNLHEIVVPDRPREYAPVERSPALDRRLAAARAALPASAFVAGVVLALASLQGAFATPARATDTLLAAIQRGDVDRLTTDTRLALSAPILRLAMQLGREEYDRVLAIYRRVSVEGTRRYNDWHAIVDVQGGRAFNNLEPAQRQAIRSESETLWVLERGFNSSAAAPVRAELPTLALVQQEPASLLLHQLGARDMPAAEQQLLGARTEADPAVAADPQLGTLALRRKQLGLARWGALRNVVLEAGRALLDALPPGEQQDVRSRSVRMYIARAGMQALSAADRGLIVGPEDFFEDEATQALVHRLGLSQLGPLDREAVSGGTQAQFQRNRDAYVLAKGRDLLQRRLRHELGSARYSIRRARAQGDGAGDLFLRSTARVALEWRSVTSSDHTAPREVSLRWEPDAAEWHVETIDWSELPAAEVSPSAPSAPAPSSGDPS